MELLNKAAVSYQIVLTKTDKIKPPAVTELESAILEIIKKNPAAYPEVIATSSEKKSGFSELKAAIARLL